MQRSDCIIAVPCFNEAKRLRQERFLEFVSRRPRSGLIFVDDGSLDDTARALEAIVKNAPHQMALMRMERNRGKGEAVRQGLRHALELQPRYVGFWDADLATSLDEVDHFERYLEAHPTLQMAIGSRVRMLGCAVKRTLIRHYLSRAAASAVSFVLRTAVHDSQCGAKLCRATAETRAVLELPFAARWLFDVELIARYAELGPLDELVHELPLRRWESVGDSRLRLRDLARIPLELVKIYKIYGRRLRAREPLSR
jgi:glycosyltransferase involved in cell wall biosynthesis